ncbi:MAG: ribosome biogenesis GTPase YlqF [Clostridia bacterium]|nr:ribosome biogenesis GTPase YlqF [Clostridia bacterium]
MVIQWFPGHMTKALREMEKEMKNIDIVFYLLDARAPLSCFNPKLTQVAKNKKIIYILNKADLVDEKDITRFKSILQKQNADVVALNSTQSNSGKVLFLSAKKLLEEKVELKKSKGINYSIKVMVVGVPNVGKSTLINNMCGFSKTTTGDRPGVTRGKQWVTTKEGFLLLDTPGTLWPSFEEERIGKNLAYIGSIKDELLDDLAFYFIKDIVKKYGDLLEKRYDIKIEDNCEILDILEKICTSRNCLLKNNELDYDRCGRMIIDDFRKGRLGKIVLD